MPRTLNIVARKPRDTEGNEYVVIDRGEGVSMRFVSATANALSLTNREWFWGHYFPTKDEAVAHFSGRS